MTTTQATEEAIRAAFGAKVRDARERRGQTQREVSQVIGIDPSTLSIVENAAERVSNRMYWRIANHLELDATAVTQARAS